MKWIRTYYLAKFVVKFDRIVQAMATLKDEFLFRVAQRYNVLINFRSYSLQSICLYLNKPSMVKNN